MWLLKHEKKVHRCHIFPHFGQILLALSVVQLKLIDMLAEEKNHFEGPSSILRGAKWSLFIYWVSNGSTVLYLRTSVNRSSTETELFQHTGREKLNARIGSSSTSYLATVISGLIQNWSTSKIVQLHVKIHLGKFSTSASSPIPCTHKAAEDLGGSISPCLQKGWSQAGNCCDLLMAGLQHPLPSAYFLLQKYNLSSKLADLEPIYKSKAS